MVSNLVRTKDSTILYMHSEVLFGVQKSENVTKVESSESLFRSGSHRRGSENDVLRRWPRELLIFISPIQCFLKERRYKLQFGVPICYVISQQLK